MLPIIHQFLGGTFFTAGLVLLPLPIPLGLPLLVIGLSLLAPYVPAVQMVIRGLRVRYPRLNTSLTTWRHRFPPVIRNTIDKTHPPHEYADSEAERDDDAPTSKF